MSEFKIGYRIKKLREERKWSQLEFAEKMGINNSVLSRIESGKRPIEDSLINKAADIFNVSTDYLLGRTNDLNKLDKKDIFGDSDLGLWFKDIRDASPEKREELKQFWEFIKLKEKKQEPKSK
ncbi:hypothetical protein COK37_23480 [Bacillus thuringiensis]|uniref:helix-turn-helix domain-containing protein n=1 Tax=Bacillus thuringiensis TaxID=1428 RepID=UPI000BF5BC83|nr:helix-turn-helix transcriptional regulator [Bacillus thuringiensis]PEV43616.1 hypothetical protein CN432_22475 [Bacillus thuringiensis]PFR65300.1 hypothetical protein COK37_23480 [Bacillus thuringiensis]PFT78281.1 hypothetical protein COK70_17705 [Bacillus thuringiensis]PFV92735.1 hypothetical protein COL06_02635 [Bacillus thuringiensis]